MLQFEYSSGAFVYRMEGESALILFLKRSRDYDLPKGHIEKGENAQEAARREVKEETGIEGPFVAHFMVQTRYFFRKGQDKISKSVKFFLEKTDEKRIRISDEHMGYEWLGYEDIMKKVKYNDVKELMPGVFEYIRKYEAMAKLNKEYSKLPETLLGWQLSRRFVPGEGPLDASTILLGEAPGAKEDELLRPFVGRSGQLLDKILLSTGLKRNNFYIVSVVQFRPPENRIPTSAELEACRKFLSRQIEIIKPRNIVLLGRTASNEALGVGNMLATHGSSVEKDGIRYFITYHPAAALRSTTNLRRMVDDFRRIKTLIK